MFGLLVMDKPPGPTSHDVVAAIRRRLERGTRVGHAGTLDPFARGVLVVCIGPATRLADYVQAQPKRYAAVVYLGAASTTDDPTGEISPLPGAAAADETAVRAVLGRFVGLIRQVPPAHSAVHVEGRRAYRLARQGRPPELPPREVAIHGIELIEYAWPRLTLDVRCGSGTYIRALARDIGAALGAGGYCERLTRTAVGPFRIEDAAPLDAPDLLGRLLPPLAALPDMPRAVIAGPQIERIRRGNVIDLPARLPSGEVALLDERGDLLALADCPDGRRAKPTKVLAADPQPPA